MNFKKIESGQNKGLVFKDFIFRLDKIIPVSMLVLFNILLIAYEGTLELGWFLGSIAFINTILGVFIWKTLQHWDDLKKNQSR